MRQKKLLKKVIYVVLTLTILAFFAGCGSDKGTGGGDSAKNTEPIKIGLIYSGSGSGAHVGEEMKKAFEMNIEKINKAGGIDGRKVEGVEANDDSNSEKAVTVAKKMVYEDKVVAIFGPVTSSAIFAVQQGVTEAGKTPLISITGSSPKLTTKGQKWYFRNSISSDHQTANLVKFAMEKRGLKRFAILYDSARAKDQYEGFAKDLGKAGLKPVAVEQFQTGDTSFNAQLLNIKKANPDAIMLLGMISEGAAAAKQAKDLGIKAIPLGVVALTYQEYIDLGGAAVEGTLAPATFQLANPDPKVQDFVKEYKAYSGKDPDHPAAHTTDAMTLVFDAMKKGILTGDLAKDREAINKAMTEVTDYKGVAGQITYSDTDRDGYQDPMIFEVKGGKWLPAE